MPYPSGLRKAVHPTPPDGLAHPGLGVPRQAPPTTSSPLCCPSEIISASATTVCLLHQKVDIYSVSVVPPEFLGPETVRESTLV